jgi:hypothetical protein
MADTVESALDRTRGSRRWLRYGVLTVVAILILFPMYVTVIFALKPGDAIFSYPRALLPVDLTLDTLHDAWTQGHFARYLVNSAIVSLAITVGAIATSLLAAYAFSFMRFPLKNVLFYLVLATLLVPAEVTVLANSDTIKTLGWTDSYQGLVAVWRLRRRLPPAPVFLTVPKDLRERLAPMVSGTSASCARWPCRSPARHSARSPSSRSSGPGASTSGRSASPTTPTTGPSRSGCGRCPVPTPTTSTSSWLAQ